MVGVIGVAEQRAELTAIVLDTAISADFERSGVEINPAFMFGPVPFIAEAFDLIEVAGDDMGDLARRQFAFAIAKRTEIDEAFGASEQLGQKIVADGHDDNR